MGTNIPHITYPYILMNHLAMMLIMLRERFYFTKQVEVFLGAPVRVMPPEICPDGNKPIAFYYRGPDISYDLKIRGA